MTHLTSIILIVMAAAFGVAVANQLEHRYALEDRV